VRIEKKVAPSRQPCHIADMSGKRQRNPSALGTNITFCGETLKAKDFRRIQKLIDGEFRPTRQQIARETCRLCGWRRPSGAPPVRACRELLVRLERMGIIRLPLPRRSKPSVSTALPRLKNDFLLGPTPGWTGAAAKDAAFELRPILAEERDGFRAYMQRYHYLGDSPLVGESLRYGAWLDGELVALLGWTGATLHNGARDRYVGWDDACRRERLHLVVNNARYLILPWVRQPNLASRVLGANLRRLSADWQAVYGHPVLLAETFVDLSRFQGTCYRASNWVCVGQTKGWSRHGANYKEHGQPKAVFLYPLHRRALQQLRASLATPDMTGEENTMTLDVDKLPLEGEGGLFSVFTTFTETRKARGLRYPLQSVLALAACAVLAGQRNFVAIAEWAADQTKEQLKRLGCRYGRPPKERTFRRVLKYVVDAEEVDKKLGLWVAEQQPLLKGMGIAIDGKTLRGSRDGEKKGVHLLSAVVQGPAVVVAQTHVSDKTNEIPRIKPLLAELDLEGTVVTADALHTQKETARYLVEDKRADYVLTAKDNQPTMREDIEELFTTEEQQAQRRQAAQDLDDEAFPPCARDRGQGSRPDRNPPDLDQHRTE
jgi:predicted transposase YbfD/YdcC